MTLSEAQQKIQQLESKLKRERASRKKAEEILRKRSVSLAENNDYLTNMTTRLQSALWVNKQVVWEYVIDNDAYYMFKRIDKTQVSIGKSGSFDEIVNTLHEDDRAIFCKHWQDHINNYSKSFNLTIRRYSNTHKAYRWVQMFGKKVSNKQTHKIEKVVGLYSDVNNQYVREEALNCVSNAFLKSELPGAVIDFTNSQIVVTDSFTIMITGQSIAMSQQELAQVIPVSLIQQQLTNQITKFDATLQVNGQPLSVSISLLTQLQKTSESETPRYGIAFFHLNRK